MKNYSELIKDNPLVKLEAEAWLNYLKIGIGNIIDIKISFMI